jgi:hypothetical protein
LPDRSEYLHVDYPTNIASWGDASSSSARRVLPKAEHVCLLLDIDSQYERMHSLTIGLHRQHTFKGDQRNIGERQFGWGMLAIS